MPIHSPSPARRSLRGLSAVRRRAAWSIPQPIDPDNCHRGAIHAPGHIQPHGVLIALDLQERLTHASRNAASVATRPSALGARLHGDGAEADTLPRPSGHAIAAASNDAATGQESASLDLEVILGEAAFDAVLIATTAGRSSNWSAGRFRSRT